MLDNYYDENFLRYLTATVPLSVFEHRILDPLQEDLSSDKLRHVFSGIDDDPLRDMHLYISLPFCTQACSFCHCDYRVVRKRSDLMAYEDYLAGQAAFFGSLSKEKAVSSIYVGGGTPSLFSKDALERIFSVLSKHLNCSAVNAVIFEGTPATLPKDKLLFLAEAGVTRLTVGVQSLNPEVLNAVGRRQTSEQVARCIVEAKDCGIPFVNADLVTGLPGESLNSFCKGLKELILMQPDGIHVNPFSDVLTADCFRNTGMNFKTIASLRQKMVCAAKEILESNGYWRKGFEAWQRSEGGDNVQQEAFMENSGDIIGIGFGAQSNFYGRAIIRNKADNTEPFLFHGCEISKDYTISNYMISHVLKGVSPVRFKDIFDQELEEVFGEEMDLLERKGIIHNDGRLVRYTGPWTPEGLFEYFSMIKIFLGRELLDQLRIRHNAYDPDHIYTFVQDGFLTKMNDAFFLLTLYDTGY